MQPEGAIGPKLDLDGFDAKTAPMGRAFRAKPMLCALFCDLGHEGGAAFQGARLL